MRLCRRRFPPSTTRARLTFQLSRHTRRHTRPRRPPAFCLRRPQISSKTWQQNAFSSMSLGEAMAFQPRLGKAPNGRRRRTPRVQLNREPNGETCERLFCSSGETTKPSLLAATKMRGANVTFKKWTRVGSNSPGATQEAALSTRILETRASRSWTLSRRTTRKGTTKSFFAHWRRPLESNAVPAAETISLPQTAGSFQARRIRNFPTDGFTTVL